MLFSCRLDGVVAVVEEMDLREHYDVRQPGGHAGSSVCLDYLELYSMLDGKNSFEPKKRNKLCFRTVPDLIEEFTISLNGLTVLQLKTFQM